MVNKRSQRCTWRREEFEVNECPAEGDDVQYAVPYILQLQQLGIPIDEVKFFMREPMDK